MHGRDTTHAGDCEAVAMAGTVVGHGEKGIAALVLGCFSGHSCEPAGAAWAAGQVQVHEEENAVWVVQRAGECVCVTTCIA